MGGRRAPLKTGRLLATLFTCLIAAQYAHHVNCCPHKRHSVLAKSFTKLLRIGAQLFHRALRLLLRFHVRLSTFADVTLLQHLVHSDHQIQIVARMAYVEYACFGLGGHVLRAMEAHTGSISKSNFKWVHLRRTRFGSRSLGAGGLGRFSTTMVPLAKS
ncbi:hypothetical protein BpHYR1_003581 [Brachionus plicatilis]|uniref:Secreted protein n=1 Tax=Brachionus plicatilis TaxID=10195 RepID=A0A3M7SYT9_BRAPC|nr:hypothetical protein BpHYR1_003581 [Brachionus plicatilis]